MEEGHRFGKMMESCHDREITVAIFHPFSIWIAPLMFGAGEGLMSVPQVDGPPGHKPALRFPADVQNRVPQLKRGALPRYHEFHVLNSEVSIDGDTPIVVIFFCFFLGFPMINQPFWGYLHDLGNLHDSLLRAVAAC